MPDYIITINKSAGGRDSANKWANRYEVVGSAVSVEGLTTMANAIATAEKNIHSNFVEFISAVVSTWAPEPTGYNPTASMTIPLTGAGLRAPSQAIMLDLDCVYHVAFQTATGRNGRRFYRGCVAESDVEATANIRWRISAASDLAAGAAVFVAFRNALLPYLNAGAETNKIAIITEDKNAPSVIRFRRNVTDVVPAGVIVNRRNHAYFDRQ